MADCITLKEIEDAVVALDRSDIRTLEDLRRCIGKDVNKSILWLSEQTTIDHALLVALLIAEFNDDRGLSGKRKLRHYWRGLKTFRSVVRFCRDELGHLWRYKKTSVLRYGPGRIWPVAVQVLLRQQRLLFNWRRHWADALVIIILPLLLFGLALRARSINNRQVPHVTVQKSIPAFQKVTGNLALTNVPSAKNAFTSVEEVNGRYALVNLAPDTTLVSDQVLNDDLSGKMEGRRILTVPIKAGTYVSTMNAPREAIMVLSPRSKDVKDLAAASFEVIVLRVDKTAETISATVAIRKEDLDKASPLLASHDVFLTQSGVL
jgi:hypothetical protein